MTGWAAELKIFGQNIWSADPKVWSEKVCALVRELGQITLEFGLGVAPGEVGVALLKANLAERVHHGWASEGLCQEDDIGKLCVDLCNEPLPEIDRLSVRVVDPENPDSKRNPVLHDAKNL